MWAAPQKLWQNHRREQRHMANPSGSFVWYELMTPDPDAIAPFYTAVVDQGSGTGTIWWYGLPHARSL
jgi:hypothetical protein